jgi:protein-S-isoprenylcysteine O-methyltransferase Ste14
MPTVAHKASAAHTAFSIYHYSRISVATAAAVMTAASAAAILRGTPDQLQIRTPLAIGCATLLGYWLDDLIDLRRDESRDPTLRSARRVRMAMLAGGIAIVLPVTLLLLFRAHPALLLLLGGIALLALLHSLRHALLHSRRTDSAPYPAQVAGWSAACVLSPQAGAGLPFTVFTWMALSFFILMIGPVIDMWRNPSPQPARRVRWLAAECLLAAAAAIVVIAFHVWPWCNLALLAAPACNLLLLWVRQRGIIARRIDFIETLVTLNILCGLLEIGANRSPLLAADAGPRSFADWFHLGAVAALGILIVANLLRRRSVRPVRGDDHFSAAVTIGGAVFAFHTLQTSFHLESWLFPWISSPLFDSAWSRALGIAFMGAGILVIALCYVVMGHSWRIAIDHAGSAELIQSGPFRTSRNPIYLAADAFVAGSFLICPTLGGLAYLLITPAILHAQIRREEKFLSARFSAEYRQYAAATPRYLFRW